MGNSAAHPSITPVNMGLRSKPERMMSCVCWLVGDPARQLARVLVRTAQEAEHRHRRAGRNDRPSAPQAHAIARLLAELAEVNAAAINAWRRARLQAPLRATSALSAALTGTRRADHPRGLR